MQEAAREAEALRRRLYRPGASTDDVAAYTTAATRARPASAATTAPVSRSSLPATIVVTAAVAVAAGLLSGVLVVSPRAAPSAAPSASSDAAAGTAHHLVIRPAIVDTGRAPHAVGAADTSGPELWQYIVAAGDTPGGVASRFLICRADVLLALPYGVEWRDVRPGHVLTLTRSERSADPSPGC